MRDLLESEYLQAKKLSRSREMTTKYNFGSEVKTKIEHDKTKRETKQDKTTPTPS
jgi:hypothetical protein